jgi:nitrile hydratase beta subunit
VNLRDRVPYRSHADLGGQRGHGRVVPECGPEPEGELWHAPWEPRALALTLAMGASGQWNIDMSRAARESLPDYARLSYYEIWLHALEKLMLERELVGADEIARGRSLRPSPLLSRVLRAADVAAVLARGSPTERFSAETPRFAVGDAVRTFAGEVPHHTRLPRYTRGKRGVVVAHHGAHVFADAHASGRGEMPCHLYTVAFDGGELWPEAADRAEANRCRVSIDAWEPYLEPA